MLFDDGVIAKHDRSRQELPQLGKAQHLIALPVEGHSTVPTQLSEEATERHSPLDPETMKLEIFHTFDARPDSWAAA